jgi:hypothetical protein
MMSPSLSMAEPRKRSAMWRHVPSAGTLAAALAPVWPLKMRKVICGIAEVEGAGTSLMKPRLIKVVVVALVMQLLMYGADTPVLSWLVIRVVGADTPVT